MAANTARIVHLEGGRLKGTSAVDINALFRALPLDANTLVIHFHGGLVSAAAGREIAARLQPEYTSAGGLPVFVVWESGWYETITNNLDAILSEAFFKSLLTLVVKAALWKLGGDSPGERGLGTSPTQVEMELELTHRGI